MWEIDTLREAIALNAFASPIPLLFHDTEKLSAMCSDASAFSRYQKHSQWKSGRDQLQKKMNSVRTGLEEAIKGEIPTTDHAHQICLLAVANTVSNLEGLPHFINSIRETGGDVLLMASNITSQSSFRGTLVFKSQSSTSLDT
mmetsp:Transcript_3377/g.5157  ORF Transcript_3377/g.5157 Transcript_3377/m.5157 type:complete len:143 (-) Transcript_3377:492-920(-)